ncbi:hypothetical protein GCM10010129_52280 [Streptomyces fumigatiscleroticus]|nr:hypothetical protein GCM10010129_52280 [Streptomyces fumigatiscleroticus]
MRVTLSSVMVMAVAVLTAACSAQGGGEEGAGSCAFTATYGGRTYTGVANVDFTLGDALGTAEFPPCDDTGRADDAAVHEPTTAYAVDGLDPRVGIAVRYAPDEVMLLAVESDGGLPLEVEKLNRNSTASQSPKAG